MRILRILAVVAFALSLGVNLWATSRYREENNTEGPALVCDSEYLEISVSDPAEILMQGLTASDGQDGDLTDKILVASTSYFLEPGVFDIDYVVFDSHRNCATATRRVHYTDYTAPRFNLSMPLVFQRGENVRYLNYVTATDCLDGDITDQIKVVASDVSNYTAGTYPVLLEVSNSYGDTVQVELMVEVREKNSYNVSIALTGYLVYLDMGEAFDPYSLISSVTETAGTRLDAQNVQVLGTVDTQAEGCYQLIYSYDTDGDRGQTRLTVVVKGEVA